MSVRVIRFLVAAALLAVPVFVNAQAQNDHLQCYQVKDALNLAAVVDLNSPQFGLEAGCKVSKAKFFCVPAEKTVVSAENKSTGLPIVPLPVTGPDAGDRVCYKVKCPNPNVPIPDQPVTDQFGNRTVTKFKTSYLCTPAVKGTYQRFVDNGDGTVTDRQTGLQWEKKDSAGGGENLNNPHDVDNFYSWNTVAGGTIANGTAFTDFLPRLNGASSDGVTLTGCFAGHCDWRLPTIVELQTILKSSFPCGTNPCIDPVFGPTVKYWYWSTTPYADDSLYAWTIYFVSGNVNFDAKDFMCSVRAVRTGS
jgi:hypothetical protein